MRFRIDFYGMILGKIVENLILSLKKKRRLGRQ